MRACNKNRTEKRVIFRPHSAQYNRNRSSFVCELWSLQATCRQTLSTKGSVFPHKSVLRLFGRSFPHRVLHFPTSQDLDSSADPFHTWFSISPNKSGLRLFIRPFPDRVEYFLPKVRTYTVRQTPSTKGSAFPPKSQDLYCSADPLHIGFSISSQKSRLRLFHSYQGVLFSESLKKNRDSVHIDERISKSGTISGITEGRY